MFCVCFDFTCSIKASKACSAWPVKSKTRQLWKSNKMKGIILFASQAPFCHKPHFLYLSSKLLLYYGHSWLLCLEEGLTLLGYESLESLQSVALMAYLWLKNRLMSGWSIEDLSHWFFLLLFLIYFVIIVCKRGDCKKLFSTKSYFGQITSKVLMLSGSTKQILL